MTLTAELGDLSRMHDDNPAGMQELAFEPTEPMAHAAFHEGDVMDVPIAEAGRSLLGRAVLMSGACMATMIGASLLRREDALRPLEVLAQGVGIGEPRLVDRIRPLAAGAAVLVGGALVLGLVDRGLRMLTAHSSPAIGRIASGVGVPVVAYGVDQLVMKEGFVARLGSVLGMKGMIAKYAAMGIASALARR